MAPTKFMIPLMPFLLPLLVSNIAAFSSEAKFGMLKQTDMVFYMHDAESGTNATATPVGGIPNKRWWVMGFGTLYTCADVLTQGYNRSSTEVGKAQGLYINSAIDGSDVHIVVSLVFTNGKFNGSTLEIQGADRLLNKYREVSVVGGTGVFRLARGYAALETVFLDLPNAYAIVRWNLIAFHY